MTVWLIDWKWVKFETFLKVKWEGIKGLSQTFIFAFWSPWIQILFKIQNPRENMTWLLPFKMKKGFLENIWTSFGNISNSETLCNSMIFSREDKMTSSNYRKYELEVFLKFSATHFQYLSSLKFWKEDYLIYLFYLQLFSGVNINERGNNMTFPNLGKWRFNK